MTAYCQNSQCNAVKFMETFPQKTFADRPGSWYIGMSPGAQLTYGKDGYPGKIFCVSKSTAHLICEYKC